MSVVCLIGGKRFVYWKKPVWYTSRRMLIIFLKLVFC